MAQPPTAKDYLSAGYQNAEGKTNGRTETAKRAETCSREEEQIEETVGKVIGQGHAAHRRESGNHRCPRSRLKQQGDPYRIARGEANHTSLHQRPQDNHPRGSWWKSESVLRPFLCYACPFPAQATSNSQGNARRSR